MVATLQEFVSNMVDRVADPASAEAMDVLVGDGVAQAITITGSPTGGTYRLGFRDEVTVNIAHNSNAGAVEAYLEALDSIGSGYVDVTGTLPNLVAQFSGPLRFNRDSLELTDNSLTGGTTPSVTIAADAVDNNTMIAFIDSALASAAAQHSGDNAMISVAQTAIFDAAYEVVSVIGNNIR